MRLRTSTAAREGEAAPDGGAISGRDFNNNVTDIYVPLEVLATVLSYYQACQTASAQWLASEQRGSQ